MGQKRVAEMKAPLLPSAAPDPSLSQPLQRHLVATLPQYERGIGRRVSGDADIDPGCTVGASLYLQWFDEMDAILVMPKSIFNRRPKKIRTYCEQVNIFTIWGFLWPNEGARAFGGQYSVSRDSPDEV
jgi:hypothetical protein